MEMVEMAEISNPRISIPQIFKSESESQMSIPQISNPKPKSQSLKYSNLSLNHNPSILESLKCDCESQMSMALHAREWLFTLVNVAALCENLSANP